MDQQPNTEPQAHHVSERPPHAVRRRNHFLTWVVILLLVAGGYLFIHHRRAEAASEKKPSTPPPTPVVAAKAVRGNIGVYFTGLGAVTPLYTVTVKSRVDGQLMKVNYKEGDMVHRGDVLAEIDERPFQATLMQAQGDLLKDQANLENARVDLTRYENLVKTNAAPEQQLATQRAVVKQDEGQVKTDEGTVESAKVNLVYCKITSPMDGRVGLRLVDPGNIVQTGDSTGLLVITQVQPISVIFTLAEDQLPEVVHKLHAGQALPVDAYDREMKNKIAAGRLIAVDNQIDQSTGTLKLRANFDNNNEALFPNQFVNARLLVQEKKNVILIPTAAVQRSSSSTYVYVVKPDATLDQRQIKLGTQEGDQSEVTEGLEEGDVVVMTGVDKLQEGTKVAVHFQGEKGEPGATGGTGAAGGTGNSGAKKGKGHK